MNVCAHWLPYVSLFFLVPCRSECVGLSEQAQDNISAAFTNLDDILNSAPIETSVRLFSFPSPPGHSLMMIRMPLIIPSMRRKEEESLATKKKNMLPMSLPRTPHPLSVSSLVAADSLQWSVRSLLPRF